MYMVKKKGIKHIVKRSYECPHCKKKCTVVVSNHTITPAVAAKREITVKVEKAVQKTLV